MRKGKKILHWSCDLPNWQKNSSITDTIESVVEETPELDLKQNIVRMYHEKIYNPEFQKNNLMRRLRCSVQMMKFQEIHYTMGEEYKNKENSERGKNYVRYLVND